MFFFLFQFLKKQNFSLGNPIWSMIGFLFFVHNSIKTYCHKMLTLKPGNQWNGKNAWSFRFLLQPPCWHPGAIHLCQTLYYVRLYVTGVYFGIYEEGIYMVKVILRHSARMRAGSSPTSTHFQSAPKVVEIDEIC